MKRYFLAIAFCALSLSTHADPLESYIAPNFGGYFINETRISSPTQQSTVEGFRYTFGADFAALRHNVSAHLNFGFGSYIDFAGQFRIFDHSLIPGEGGGTFMYGIGHGISYSPGIVQDQAFVDLSVILFVRALFDTEKDWGLYLETNYEVAYYRQLMNSAEEDRNVTHRFQMALGIPFASNW